MRAERRVGELMEEQRGTTGLSKGAAITRGTENPASLREAGIDKNLTHRARKLALAHPACSLVDRLHRFQISADGHPNAASFQW